MFTRARAGCLQCAAFDYWYCSKVAFYLVEENCWILRFVLLAVVFLWWVLDHILNDSMIYISVFPQGALSHDTLGHAVSPNTEFTSALIGLIAADVVFFPMETILHR